MPIFILNVKIDKKLEKWEDTRIKFSLRILYYRKIKRKNHLPLFSYFNSKDKVTYSTLSPLKMVKD